MLARSILSPGFAAAKAANVAAWNQEEQNASYSLAH
jgi:hypothetical protein